MRYKADNEDLKKTIDDLNEIRNFKALFDELCKDHEQCKLTNDERFKSMINGHQINKEDTDKCTSNLSD